MKTVFFSISFILLYIYSIAQQNWHGDTAELKESSNYHKLNASEVKPVHIFKEFPDYSEFDLTLHHKQSFNSSTNNGSSK